MPRDRLFISYSHQDEAFLQAFRVHLKPWEDRELLETWSDHQINTSQDWHQTIQAALQETAVVVLLISPDFLASDYIRQHELPDLLRAGPGACPGAGATPGAFAVCAARAASLDLLTL